MQFTRDELIRLKELASWGIEKGIKDENLKSASQKLNDMFDEQKYNQKEVYNVPATLLGFAQNDYDEFGYLGLDPAIRDLVISKIEAGMKNMYHSVMAVLQNKIKHRTLQDKDVEVQLYIDKYRSKYRLNGEELEATAKLVRLCYNKLQSKI